jgi:Phage tail assembly chaperone proteins, E, or 41 or 14
MDFNQGQPVREGFQSTATGGGGASVTRQNGPTPSQPQPQAQPTPTVIDVTPEPPPIETAPPPERIETWPITVKLLHKPIRGMKNEVLKELSFREPTGGDINRYGNPCRIDFEGNVIIDEQKMHRVMAALSGLLPPLLEGMDPRDWNSCAFRLRNFFLPELAAW